MTFAEMVHGRVIAHTKGPRGEWIAGNSVDAFARLYEQGVIQRFPENVPAAWYQPSKMADKPRIRVPVGYRPE